MSDNHVCDYPETAEGNWVTIGKCHICGQLPSFEHIERIMRQAKGGGASA